MIQQQPVIRVIDDDPSFRRAASRVLQLAGYLVREFGSAVEFLESGVADEPGCLILDLQMPGVDGLQLQEALAQSGVTVPILFLSGKGDIPKTVRAMRAGALNFLTKPVEADDLLEAVDQALARDAALRTVRERLAELRSRLAALTPREREVFDLVVQGKLNKQIAVVLGTTERTIKAHRSRVMEKLQVESVAELVHIAEQLERLENPSR
jgi:RNA polymerase sigma factor (sigma-70 family)